VVCHGGVGPFHIGQHFRSACTLRKDHVSTARPQLRAVNTSRCVTRRVLAVPGPAMLWWPLLRAWARLGGLGSARTPWTSRHKEGDKNLVGNHEHLGGGLKV